MKGKRYRFSRGEGGELNLHEKKEGRAERPGGFRCSELPRENGETANDRGKRKILL